MIKEVGVLYADFDPRQPPGVFASVPNVVVIYNGAAFFNFGPNVTDWLPMTGFVGSATLDFGSATTSMEASVTITGQTSIVASTSVRAWISPATTANHTPDEHMVEDIDLYVENIVPGVGFTIVGMARGPSGTFGQYNVNWSWQ